MNQGTRSLVAVFGLYFLSASWAMAGFESNGGGAFVCRDADNKIKAQPLSVELLDLFEAEHLYKLHLRRDDMSSLSIQESIDVAFEKLKSWDPVLYQVAIGFVPYNKPSMVAVSDPSVQISKPIDVGSMIQKRGCPLEGAASYDDISGILLYDPEILGAMGSFDYAALMVHEAVYKARRVWNHDTDSVESRRIVGFLFSHEAVPTLYKNQSPGSLNCETTPPSFSFMLSREPSGLPTFSNWYVLQFSQINGIRPMAFAEIKVQDTTEWASKLYEGSPQNLSMTTDPISPTAPYFPIDGLDVASELERFPMISVSSRPGFPVVHCKALRVSATAADSLITR